eukprot:GHVR01033886.1.p1 GENE.GHVR01033886.1~~GHVR01033886.1.p1  ORF type:complete len:190 (-),score=18.54 GHVR01033886.1:106-675(-)
MRVRLYACVYVCMYVCIDSSARRPNHTEFEKTTESEQTTARLGAVRETSEEHPGGVRGAPGRRPRSIREAPEECPGSARELSETRPNCVPKAFVAKPGPRITKIGDPVRSCLTFSVRIVKLPSVFEEFRGGVCLDGRRDGCPRFCKTTAPVQEVENRRACAHELHRSLRKCAQDSSFEFEACVSAVPVQ